MAQTRLRLGPQLQQSSTPGSILTTNTSNEAQYTSPSTGADRLWGYDDSAEATVSVTIGSGLTMTGTTLSVTGGSSGYSEIQEEGTPVGASNTKINFVGGGFTAADAGAGVTSITLDATLNALAAYDTNGILTQTSTNTFTGRTITGTPDRIDVTNGSGVAGNPVIDIDAGYEGQASIITLGIVSTGTWNATAIGPTFGGTGLSTYTLGDTLYASATNTLSKLAGNTTTTRKYLSQIGNGSISAAPTWQEIAEADIADGAILARLAADETVTGNWEFTNNVVVPTVPTADDHAASKLYVDSLNFGFVKHYADLASASNVTLSGEQTIDGTLTSTSRVFLFAQTDLSENGIYDTGAGAWTRVTDLNTEAEVNEALVVIVSGTTYAGTFWVTIEDIVTLETDDINWIQVNSPVTLVAGNGLTKTGDTVDVVTASSARIVVAANSIDLATTAVTPGSYGNASNVSTFTVDAYGRLTAASQTAIAVASTAITDFQEAVQDVVGNASFLLEGDGMTITYNDVANTLTLEAANLYNSDGTIPAAITRTVSLGDVDSLLIFENAATATLLSISDDSLYMMDGVVGIDGDSINIVTSGGSFILEATGLSIETSASNPDNYTFTDNRTTTRGLEYAADYSDDFTNRTLVDKQYVDDAIAGAAANAVEAFIEGSTATTIDLDANVGNVKDVDGNNIAFTLPSNLAAFFVYRNGVLQAESGDLTTRDYSVNTGTNSITFSTALTASEIVILKKF